jgi:tetratricopeptide (TPR) repeat protein
MMWSRGLPPLQRRQGAPPHYVHLHIPSMLLEIARVTFSRGNHQDERPVTNYQQSLEIKRRIGDLAGTASTLGNLGIVYRNQGRYDEAIAHYQQSLDITRRIGHVATTARNSWNLGLIYEKQGDLAAALPLIEEAAQIAERVGMPHAAEWRTKVEALRAGGGV